MSEPTNNDSPSDETLRHQLQIQWQDHIQTRSQTWKSLQVVAAIFLALIGADIKLNDPHALLSLGGVVLVSTLFGMAVTIHHRKVQIKVFQTLYMLEEKLGLHKPTYMDDIEKPKDLKWSLIFSTKDIKTPVFIWLMHVMILLFSIIYITTRIMT